MAGILQFDYDTPVPGAAIQNQKTIALAGLWMLANSTIIPSPAGGVFTEVVIPSSSETTSTQLNLILEAAKKNLAALGR